MTNPISSPSTQAILLAIGLGCLAFVGIPYLGSPPSGPVSQVGTEPVERAMFQRDSLNKARTSAGYLRQSDGSLVTVSVDTVQATNETLVNWAARHARAVAAATKDLGTDTVPPLELHGSMNRADPMGLATWIDDSGRVTDLRVHNNPDSQARASRPAHLDALRCFTRHLTPAGAKR